MFYDDDVLKLSIKKIFFDIDRIKIFTRKNVFVLHVESDITHFCLLQ